MVSFVLHSASFFCCHVFIHLVPVSFYLFPDWSQIVLQIYIISWPEVGYAYRSYKVVISKRHGCDEKLTPVRVFFFNCRWEGRLCPMNHHAYFPVDVTVIWDTTCFRSLIRYMSICSNYDFCVPLGFSGSGSRGTGLMVVMSSMVNEIPP